MTAVIFTEKLRLMLPSPPTPSHFFDMPTEAPSLPLDPLVIFAQPTLLPSLQSEAPSREEASVSDASSQEQRIDEFKRLLWALLQYREGQTAEAIDHIAALHMPEKLRTMGDVAMRRGNVEEGLLCYAATQGIGLSEQQRQTLLNGAIRKFDLEKASHAPCYENVLHFLKAVGPSVQPEKQIPMLEESGVLACMNQKNQPDSIKKQYDERAVVAATLLAQIEEYQRQVPTAIWPDVSSIDPSVTFSINTSVFDPTHGDGNE